MVYFLTFCVRNRRKVLANEATWSRILQVQKRLDRWSFLSTLAMPDHLHMLVAPSQDRDEKLSNMIMWFKRWFNEGRVTVWQWQDGGFDRLLRSDESVDEKWAYIRNNPVRAQLVSNPDEWPFQITQFRS